MNKFVSLAVVSIWHGGFRLGPQGLGRISSPLALRLSGAQLSQGERDATNVLHSRIFDQVNPGRRRLQFAGTKDAPVGLENSGRGASFYFAVLFDACKKFCLTQHLKRTESFCQLYSEVRT